jgi:hypothetical protein
MACSKVGRRIMVHTLIFIVWLFMPLFLSAGKTELGFEITDDHRGFSISLSGGYVTDYVEAKININPHKSFPHNFSLQTLPVYKTSNTEADNAFSTVLATSLTIANDTLIYVAQKEIERRAENQKFDLYLQRCDEAIKQSNPIFEKKERRLSHD